MLLEVENLRTTLASPRGSLVAVDGVSFTLDRGQTLGVVGESGSGKSMLAKTIMGILPSNATIAPESRITFDGEDLRELMARDPHVRGTRIAMIFQDPMTSLNPVRRIGAQVADPLRFHLGMGKREAEAKVVDLLGQVGIPAPAQRLRQYPHELSGGMRQRVVIATAIACDPQLLIADEPTTALDVTVQRQIMELLARLRDAHGTAMILISHDLPLVASQSDQFAIMYAARVVEYLPRDTPMRHRYTEALVKSHPDADSASHSRLLAISGRPPDLVNPPTGCRFNPRCPHAREKCTEEDPLLFEESPGHLYACFFPVEGAPPSPGEPVDAAATAPQLEA